MKGAANAKEAGAEEVNLRGHALAPELGVIRRFMMDMIARGALQGSCRPSHTLWD